MVVDLIQGRPTTEGEKRAVREVFLTVGGGYAMLRGLGRLAGLARSRARIRRGNLPSIQDARPDERGWGMALG